MNWVLTLCLLGSLLPAGLAQTTPAYPGQAGKARLHRRNHHKARTTVLDVRPNVTVTSAGRPLETDAQRSADKRLLHLQQAQSIHNAAVNNQIVQQANDTRAKVQREVRIQDAPGPAQTGVVPAVGAPVAPTNAADRIQDAPGPAQTLPSLPATLPTGPSVPTVMGAAPAPLSQTNADSAGSVPHEDAAPGDTTQNAPH